MLPFSSFLSVCVPKAILEDAVVFHSLNCQIILLVSEVSGWTFPFVAILTRVALVDDKEWTYTYTYWVCGYSLSLSQPSCDFRMGAKQDCERERAYKEAITKRWDRKAMNSLSKVCARKVNLISVVTNRIHFETHILFKFRLFCVFNFWLLLGRKGTYHTLWIVFGIVFPTFFSSLSHLFPTFW